MRSLMAFWLEQNHLEGEWAGELVGRGLFSALEISRVIWPRVGCVWCVGYGLAHAGVSCRFP